jgi:MFS family permease
MIAVSVYLTAALHRSSLGVAGLLAAHRYGISPAQLSAFVLVQLGTYAVMQVPAGILADRIGPRRLLVLAAAMMGVAQLLFAVVPSYPAALAARTILGCGDALTFVSVLRYAAGHFSARRYPIMVGLTGMVGQVGSLAATVPLSMLLDLLGWSGAFAATSVLSLITGVVVWRALPRTRSEPISVGSAPSVGGTVRRMADDVREAWSRPATRAGFWVHFMSMSAMMIFGVLWGMPYLVQGQGFDRSGASAILLESVAVAAVASPAVGTLVARRPAVRVPFALVVTAVTVAGWLLLIAGFGGQPPHWLIVAQVAVMALGGPASAVGFALARDYNRADVMGTATGVVNVGGFVATVAGAVGIGWVLGAIGSSTPDAFRVAFLVVVAVQAAGLVQAVRWWRRTRAYVLGAQARGEHVPVPAVRHRFDLAASG